MAEDAFDAGVASMQFEIEELKAKLAEHDFHLTYADGVKDGTLEGGSRGFDEGVEWCCLDVESTEREEYEASLAIGKENFIKKLRNELLNE